MTQTSPLSLMTPEVRGGDIAEGGFRSQDHLTLAHVPGWLAEDGFTAMIREAHGDVEASFHVPGAGLTREFVEYKDHEVQPAKLRAEVTRFAEMHAGAPGGYRRFVLSTRGLSATLRPFHAALDRVRGAMPFYADVPSVADTSYKDFEAAAAEVGIDAETARFVFDNVVLEPGALDAERLGPTLFSDAAARHLPCVANARTKEVNAAITNGGFQRRLDHLGWFEAPTLERLVHEPHHDLRAALVCLLTAGFGAAGTATVVGDEDGCWLYLPPFELWAPWASAALEITVVRARHRGDPRTAVMCGATETGL